MRMRMIATALAVVLGANAGFAQSGMQAEKGNQRWVGVWRGLLDGVPSVLLTVADDDGRLGGTVVLNMVKSEDDGPHVVGSDTHMLVNAENDGGVLHFEIKGLRDGRELDFALKATAEDKANLKCLNCKDALEAEVVRTPMYAKAD